VLQPVALLGANGQPLPAAPRRRSTLHREVLRRPQQPMAVTLGLAAFLPEVLADGSVTLTIDSVLPGAG